ncbi:DUF6894 family protein [Methylobacterium brachythecii]|uniref:DUF6894 domain-containing protein n=1 Tax=Methylobacterium brachythecii TaxID=1176177 RepID=A0A7W6F9I4_9HYPH|nr:hypothetical protein [Methylobacterium brachythecii]MBB3905196.1 hypothetical protein [Methylobacterium brachythecii]GLS46232.1 hypothetical protein GCM10007884_42240 [Methylobacterium brachythecii]
MPRYFFDVHDGVEVRDDVGRVFADQEGARREALQLAADYAKVVENLSASGLLVVTVRSEAGETVAVVRLICQIDAP